MTDAQFDQLWKEYFNAQVLSRYYQLVSDNYKKKLLRWSIVLGILSCGPLTALAWNYGWGPIFGAIAGAAAGIIGIVISTSGVTRKLSTAISAAISWNEISNNLEQLRTRAHSGEDVWGEYENEVNKGLDTDSKVLEFLTVNRKLFNQADTAARNALGVQ